MSRCRSPIAAAALALSGAIVIGVGQAAAASAVETTAGATGDQVISVERPPGQMVISDVTFLPGDRVELTVTDTRPEDPGWSVSVTVGSSVSNSQLDWTPYVTHQTEAFTDSDGGTYAQHVTAGPSMMARPRRGGSAIENAILGSAPPGHGLGIARLGAKLTPTGHAEGHSGDELSTVTVSVTDV